jgi:predicted signal transduction protein with EAL and GGDEF domain
VCADQLRLVTAPFEIEGERFQVEASIGATLPSPLVTDVSGVLRRADAAMYRAKRAGAGFEVCADDVPTPVARRSAS